MMKLLLSALVSVALADYSPLFKPLADGKYDEFKHQALDALARESSIGRKVEILKVLESHKAKLYSARDFTGRALPFATDRCQPTEAHEAVCSSERGFDFVLSRNAGHPTFIIKRQGQPVQSIPARSRTLLSNPEMTFGRTLHLIYSEKSAAEFFLFIRELEKSPGLQQPVRQTMHVFRLREGNACKVLEADVTESDGKYGLIEEFVRALGPQTSCQNPPVQI